MTDLFLRSIEPLNLNQAKLLLEECSKSLFKLFNMSPACMSLTTSNRSFVKVNKKFLEVFGFTESEVIGKNSLEIGILDEEEMAYVSNLLNKNGKLENDIVKCITKQGKAVYTISSIEYIEIAGQIYLMSSFLDVSNFIDKEDILQKRNLIAKSRWFPPLMVN